MNMLVETDARTMTVLISATVSASLSFTPDFSPSALAQILHIINPHRLQAEHYQQSNQDILIGQQLQQQSMPEQYDSLQTA
jgi:hypothetical protein